MFGWLGLGEIGVGEKEKEKDLQLILK